MVTSISKEDNMKTLSNNKTKVVLGLMGLAGVLVVTGAITGQLDASTLTEVLTAITDIIGGE